VLWVCVLVGQEVFYFLTLEDGTIGCPETSVQNYCSTLRNIPEERRSHLHSGGSLKSLCSEFILVEVKLKSLEIMSSTHSGWFGSSTCRKRICSVCYDGRLVGPTAGLAHSWWKETPFPSWLLRLFWGHIPVIRCFSLLHEGEGTLYIYNNNSCFRAFRCFCAF
jgi:hypothetical protein